MYATFKTSTFMAHKEAFPADCHGSYGPHLKNNCVFNILCPNKYLNTLNHAYCGLTV